MGYQRNCAGQGVSVFVLDMGLNSFDWSENNSNLPTGDRFESV